MLIRDWYRRSVSPVGLVDDQGRLQGPFNAMLFHPAIGMALQELGRALRFSGELPPRAREIGRRCVRR